MAAPTDTSSLVITTDNKFIYKDPENNTLDWLEMDPLPLFKVVKNITEAEMASSARVNTHKYGYLGGTKMWTQWVMIPELGSRELNPLAGNIVRAFSDMYSDEEGTAAGDAEPEIMGKGTIKLMFMCGDEMSDEVRFTVDEMKEISDDMMDHLKHIEERRLKKSGGLKKSSSKR
jgi:hypothetical protein